MQGLPVALLRPGSGAVPGLALPSLAGASGEDMDASSLAVLLRLSLAAQKEEEKAAKASEARTDGISPGGGVRGLQGFSPGQASTAFPSAERSSEQIVERIVDLPGGSLHAVPGFSPGQGSTTFPPTVRISERIMEQIVDIPGGVLKGFSPGQGSTAVCGAEHAIIPVPLGRGGLGDGGLHGLSQEQGSTAVCGAEHVDIPVPHGRGKLGDGVFSASSAGAADEGPAGRGSGKGKAGFAGEDAPRGSSSRGKARAGEPADSVDKFFFEYCEFFIDCGGKWESQGHGFAKLIQHSSGAQFFQFWQNEQVWYDDVIHRVSSDVLVLKPVGRSGRAWPWMDPDFVGGPSEYRHAVRFSSPELARRFYAVWMGSG